MLAGFALTFIELRALHADVLDEYWQASIPIWSAPAAGVGALLAMGKGKALRLIGAILLLVQAPIGLFGVWNHVEGELAELSTLITAPADASSWPPALAPLGMMGLGIIGALAAWPERHSS